MREERGPNFYLGPWPGKGRERFEGRSPRRYAPIPPPEGVVVRRRDRRGGRG